ncbi:hypothetical protein AB0O28_35050, partial [Microbispora sp. NPDC088329]|uniref:hypothetical protein n=1 Tax=Microbispora sp. NPDC088329 TaxID=3154869 RepID=UPI00343A0059
LAFSTLLSSQETDATTITRNLPRRSHAPGRFTVCFSFVLLVLILPDRLFRVKSAPPGLI